MAYEPSEGLYAGLTFVKTTELEAAKTDNEKFKELYATAFANFKSDKVKDKGGEKTGMCKVIDLAGKDEKRIRELHADLASQISGVLATRKKISSTIPQTVYLTGNKWHDDVADFKVKAWGMADYNSSDVILGYGKINNKNHFIGVSLKKKPTIKADSPTLINNAFSKFIEGQDKLIKRLDDHRICFFASLIKEAACDRNGPLCGMGEVQGNKSIEKLNPNRRADAQELWDMRIKTKKILKNGKNEVVPLINLKGQGHISSDNDPIVKKGGLKPQDDFRIWVNKRLQSKNSKVNPLFTGFLNIMNEPDVKNTLANALLARVLKTSLLDELETWKKNEFGFYLVEGVGTANTSLEQSISSANVLNIHSVMIAMSKLAKSEARMVLDEANTFRRKAAKVYFILYKGKCPVLNIELRYKGSFTAMPQFFAGLTPDFKKLVKDGETT